MKQQKITFWIILISLVFFLLMISSCDLAKDVVTGDFEKDITEQFKKDMGYEDEPMDEITGEVVREEQFEEETLGEETSSKYRLQGYKRLTSGVMVMGDNGME